MTAMRSFVLSVQCESLSDPPSGFVTLATDGHTSVADYSCTPGYTIHGDSARQCQTNGSWTGIDVTCSK